MAFPLIGGILAGVGAIGSLLGSSAQSKAINRATDAQTQGNLAAVAAQERARTQSNALLNPYVQRGNAAGSAMNALLGLGGGPATTDWAAYVQGNPDAMANWSQVQGTQADRFGGDIAAFGQYHYGADGARRDLSPYTTGGGSAPDAAANAFDMFRNSTGYQFRMDEGSKALNALNAARGTLDSGAAVKSALQYGQNIGSQEFGNYLNYLGNQQGVGMGAASASAGVGQSFANNMSNLATSNASALGNLALARGQNTNDLLGNLSSSFGLGVGALTKWGR